MTDNTNSRTPSAINTTQLVDAKTAAQRLGIGVRLLWAETNIGNLPHVRIGRRVLYDVVDLAGYVEANKRRGCCP